MAPLNVAAEAGDGDALVYWDDAADAGPGTVYTVTSTPGGFTATTEDVGAIVTGLTNGTSYTFTVTATTENGTSVASNVSNAITPAADATTPPVPTATTPVVAGASAVIPVGAPNTGAGGMSGSTDAPMAGAGGLALLLAGAGATLVARRRRQV